MAAWSSRTKSRYLFSACVAASLTAPVLTMVRHHSFSSAKIMFLASLLSIVTTAAGFWLSSVTERGRARHNCFRDVHPYDKTGDPPELATYLLEFIPPKRDGEYVAGDMEEKFRTRWIPKHGRQKAVILCWWHVLVIELLPFLLRRVLALRFIWKLMQ